MIYKTTQLKRRRRHLSNARRRINKLATTESENNKLILKNTAGLPLNSLELYGNTIQKTYTGKNKINIDELAKTIVEANPACELVEFDGRRCLKIVRALHRRSVILPEGIYGLTLSCYCTGEYKAGFLFYQLANTTTEFWVSAQQDTWVNHSLYYSYNSQSFTKLGVYSENYDTSSIYLDLDSFMVEEARKGNESEYEPYVGGIPSPNPSYPQKIVNTRVDVLLNDKELSSDIELAGLDDVKDYFIANRSDFTVKHHKSIAAYTFTGDEEMSSDSDGNGNTAFIVQLPFYRKENTKYFCTHFLAYCNEPSVFSNVIEIIDNNAWIYNSSFSSIDELRQFFKSNNVQITYATNEHSEYDYSRDELTKKLFELKAAHKSDTELEILGEATPSKIKASYYTLEKENI